MKINIKTILLMILAMCLSSYSFANGSTWNIVITNDTDANIKISPGRDMGIICDDSCSSHYQFTLGKAEGFYRPDALGGNSGTRDSVVVIHPGYQYKLVIKETEDIVNEFTFYIISNDSYYPINLYSKYNLVLKGTNPYTRTINDISIKTDKTIFIDADLKFINNHQISVNGEVKNIAPIH